MDLEKTVSLTKSENNNINNENSDISDVYLKKYAKFILWSR